MLGDSCIIFLPPSEYYFRMTDHFWANMSGLGLGRENSTKQYHSSPHKPQINSSRKRLTYLPHLLLLSPFVNYPRNILVYHYWYLSHSIHLKWTFPLDFILTFTSIARSLLIQWLTTALFTQNVSSTDLHENLNGKKTVLWLEKR